MNFRNLALVAAAVLMMSSTSSADFAINDFDLSSSPEAFSVMDDFGNSYSGTIGAAVTTGSGFIAGDILFLGANSTVDITYTFTSSGDASTSDSQALGYYASNFRLENVAMGLSDDATINVSGQRTNGLTATFQPGPQALVGGTANTVFFDLTGFDHVNVLNDLQTLTFSISSIGGATLGLSNINLIATPEPTSLISLAGFAAVGLFVTRRRKRV